MVTYKLPEVQEIGAKLAKKGGQEVGWRCRRMPNASSKKLPRGPRECEPEWKIPFLYLLTCNWTELVTPFHNGICTAGEEGPHSPSVSTLQHSRCGYHIHCLAIMMPVRATIILMEKHMSLYCPFNMLLVIFQYNLLVLNTFPLHLLTAAFIEQLVVA